MKNARFPLTALLALLLVATPTFAASTKKPTPSPVMKPKPDTIESVSETSLTVKHIKMTRDKNKKITETPTTFTYTITKFTSIQVNGQSAKVDALKAGMKVTVSADGTQGQSPPPVATNIVASDQK